MTKIEHTMELRNNVDTERRGDVVYRTTVRPAAVATHRGSRLFVNLLFNDRSCFTRRLTAFRCVFIE